MKLLNKNLLIVILLFINTNFSYSEEVRIISKIKNEIITNIDIKNESLYLTALNSDMKQLNKVETYEFSKASLVTEKIKEIEIKKYYDISKENEVVNDIVKNLYKKLNFKNEEEFKYHINGYGLKIDLFKKKAKIESLWNDLIYNKFKNNIEIDIEQIKTDLQKKIKNRKKEKIYNLSEIYLTFENKNNINKKIQLIEENIKTEGFKKTALRYSNADSSKFGGELGWIKESQLSKKILTKIQNVAEGEILDIIKTSDGVIILKINKIKIESIEIDFDKKLKQIIFFERNKQLEQYSKIYFNKIRKNLDQL